MLKCFKNTKNFKSFLSRSYNYQTRIYTDLDLNKPAVNLAEIQKELADSNQKAISQPNLYRFVRAYRQYGFKISKLNPLNNEANISAFPELDPKTYGLCSSSTYATDGLLHVDSNMNLAQLEEYLKNAYSGSMTIELEHINSEEEKFWLSKEYEKMQMETLDTNTKVNLLKLMLKSEAFDHFLASKFPAFKRYSLEGGESSMAFYEGIFSSCTKEQIEELVMGIAHRGRLNLMVLLLDLHPSLLFTKIKGKSEFSSDVKVNGDISHHFPCSTDKNYNDKNLHVSLLPNPSHLEAVDPLVLGKARSKQLFSKDGVYNYDVNSNEFNFKKVMSFLIHGDAAFAGQGVVMETFQLSKLPNYSVGGTVHLITNNQLGFTTPSSLARSGQFNSDLAKSIGCPVIHVNGDHPELAYKAAQLAVKYRNAFNKDIVVDLICYRKYGHNELDDPTFTQPLMYKVINSRPSVPSMYQEKLLTENLCSKENLESEVNTFKTSLENALEDVVKGTYKIEPRNTYLKKQWSSMTKASDQQKTYFWNTGCSTDILTQIGTKSVTVPENFNVHPTIKRAHINKRLERMKDGKNIDWSTAESLAFGSLLKEGFNVRISGQDVGRGTFSQRHCLLVDQDSGNTYIPLNNMDEKQENYLEACNSNLSEEAVMGFDFGFSLDNPKNLVIWEAQFGDFFNGAQIMIDTYICSSETKWMHQSSMVMLMPHGYDGAGPEHTSCRIERFLQTCSSKEDGIDSDDVNYYIVHPTTPANYFHLLRRQMLTPYRKPLIVASPKVLLRLPECVSTINEMGPNTSFQPVISDLTVANKDSIKRVIFVFGKHYYALAVEKAKKNLNDVAIVRIEELCPFPAYEIRDAIKQFKNASEFVWAQEEHRNMGAWSFVKPRFENILGVMLKYAGRDVNCVPAVGIAELHKKEEQLVLTKPFEKF